MRDVFIPDRGTSNGTVTVGTDEGGCTRTVSTTEASAPASRYGVDVTTLSVLEEPP